MTIRRETRIVTSDRYLLVFSPNTVKHIVRVRLHVVSKIVTPVFVLTCADLHTYPNHFIINIKVKF